MCIHELKDVIPADNVRTIKDRIELGRNEKLSRIGKNDDCAPSSVLGHIESFVGLFEESLYSLPILREQRNAHTASKYDLFAFGLERSVCQPFLNIQSELPGLFFIQLG